LNEWEWVQENPMQKISKLPEPRGGMRFLDDEERERLLEACKISTNQDILCYKETHGEWGHYFGVSLIPSQILDCI
jgi:hypothetical protein